ncbi:MAG: hypothetical protein R2827_02715 [Bdellovibrionales bacterium]
MKCILMVLLLAMGQFSVAEQRYLGPLGAYEYQVSYSLENCEEGWKARAGSGRCESDQPALQPFEMWVNQAPLEFSKSFELENGGVVLGRLICQKGQIVFAASYSDSEPVPFERVREVATYFFEKLDQSGLQKH